MLLDLDPMEETKHLAFFSVPKKDTDRRRVMLDFATLNKHQMPPLQNDHNSTSKRHLPKERMVGVSRCEGGVLSSYNCSSLPEVLGCPLEPLKIPFQGPPLRT